MTLFLDTEYNGEDRQLISLALVSDQDNDKLYFVLPYPLRIDLWVMDNVIPVLFNPPYNPVAYAGFSDLHQAQMALQVFLGRHQHEEIIADWPTDFQHMLNLMYGAGGNRPNIELRMRLISTGNDPDKEPKSKMPHNALADAEALMHWYNRTDPNA